MKIEIIVDKVPGCDEEDIALFVQDAVSSWGGQKHPDDPLFHSLLVKKVTVVKRKFLFEENAEGDDVYTEVKI